MMRTFGRLLGALAAIVLVVLVIVYAGSEYMLRRTREVPLVQLAIPTDAASIAEGGRLARTTGCRGCHGPDGKGMVLLDSIVLGRIAPPALARVAPGYTDAQLLRAIRNGVRKDGSALIIMPTEAHRFIADADVAKIIAWVRSLKPTPQDSLATTAMGPLGRALILAGELKTSVHPGTVAAAERPADIGRYFVDIGCTGCHRLDKPVALKEVPQTAPALAAAAASYTPAQFEHLLTTGESKSGKDLGLMAEIAKGEARYLTPQERAAMHAYLTAEAGKMKAE